MLAREREVKGIEGAKTVRVTKVNTNPVKNSIHAMIRTWKYKYASQLHFQAKVNHVADNIFKF